MKEIKIVNGKLSLSSELKLILNVDSIEIGFYSERMKLKKSSKFSVKPLPPVKTMKTIKTMKTDNRAKTSYCTEIIFPCMDKEIILKAIFEGFKAHIRAETKIEPRKTTLSIFNVPSRFLAEFTLHELSEFIIYDVIEKISKTRRFKAIENIAHFLNAYSLEQFYFMLKTYNGIKNYVQSQRLPSFEVEEVKETRKESLFGKGKKSGENSGKEV